MTEKSKLSNTVGFPDWPWIVSHAIEFEIVLAFITTTISYSLPREYHDSIFKLSTNGVKGIVAVVTYFTFG